MGGDSAGGVEEGVVVAMPSPTVVNVAVTVLHVALSVLYWHLERKIQKEKDGEDLGGDGAGGVEEGVVVAMLEPQPHHRLRQHLHPGIRLF